MKIEKYIRELKKEWEKVKKVRTSHFLDRDWENKDIVCYYNPYQCDWTPIEAFAFQGFVFKRLQDTVNNIFHER